MIRAIIFDCFGVLTTDGWLPFKKKQFGAEGALFEAATDINKQADSGLISFEDFLGQIGEMAGVPKEEVRQAVNNNVPNDELFDYARELKQSYKIGLLSNAPENWLPELFTPEQLALIDETALSYETGHVKPSPEAYAIIAERLGVRLEECIFVDDQERFATGAREVGMKAVWFQDTDQCKAELKQLLTDSKH